MTTRSPDAPTLTPAQLAAHLAALPDAVAVPSVVRGLMVEFPLHSEWTDTEDDKRVLVLGYGIGGTSLLVQFPDGPGTSPIYIGIRHARNAYARIVPPPACPITEPLTIQRTARPEHHVASLREWLGPCPAFAPTTPDGAAITLYPASPGATEGRYTWAVTS